MSYLNVSPDKINALSRKYFSNQYLSKLYFNISPDIKQPGLSKMSTSITEYYTQIYHQLN